MVRSGQKADSVVVHLLTMFLLLSWASARTGINKSKRIRRLEKKIVIFKLIQLDLSSWGEAVSEPLFSARKRHQKS